MVSCNITCRLRLKIRLWLLSYIIYQCIYQIIVLHCSPSRTGIFNPFINVHYDFICIVMDYFFDLNVTSNAIKNLSLVVSLNVLISISMNLVLLFSFDLRHSLNFILYFPPFLLHPIFLCLNSSRCL